MVQAIKVVEVELGGPPEALGDLRGYGAIWALVRLHGTPVGRVEMPLPEAGISARDLRRVVLRRLSRQLARHHLLDAVRRPLPPGGLAAEGLPGAGHPREHPRQGDRPTVTVAVCTRDRAEDLELCLQALERLDYPDFEVVVVDNAPSGDAAERLVRGSHPRMRYVREPRPGLSWARNRAIAEARGEIIAYTDDDVVVDPGWVSGLVGAFEDPQVMAVTGLVEPHELETEAQVLFERYGGFGRGYERRWWRMDLEGGERPIGYLGSGWYGTGANMAYRLEIFGEVGAFDPALGAGTVTNGGEDLDMFFRVLRGGHVLAYEPTALVRHRHRGDYARLRKQLADNGISVSSVLVSTVLRHREAFGQAMVFWLWWLRHWHLRRLARSFVSPGGFPRDLILAELEGFLVGLGRYPRARRHGAQVVSARVHSSALGVSGKKPTGEVL